MATGFLLLLWMVTVVHCSASDQSALYSTLTWNTYEGLNNSNWVIRDEICNWSVLSKPSDLDPTLIGLDEKFTGNVWSLEGCLDWDYRYYASSIPNLCVLDDITLKIKYFLKTFNNSNDVVAWPASGHENGLYRLPTSEAIQWSEVSIKINITSLQRESIDLGKFDNEPDFTHGDIILFDEISLTFTDRGLYFSCVGKPDGSYRRTENPSSFWECNAGEKTVGYCPKHHHFSHLGRKCRSSKSGL